MARKISAAIFAILGLIACDPEEETLQSIPNNNHETIDGTYEVTVHEIENTCNSEEHADFRTWIYIIVQEQDEDNGLVANIFIGNFIWFMVDVDLDGNFNAWEDFFEDYYNHIEGVVTPSEIQMIMTIQLLNEIDEVTCRAIYDMNGGLLFERASANDDEHIESNSETLSGIYKTRIVQTVNSCERGFVPWEYYAHISIIMQEQREDGTAFINMAVNLLTAFLSLENMPVAEDGTVNFPNPYGATTGALTPDHLSLSITMYARSDGYICLSRYELDGYSLYERA